MADRSLHMVQIMVSRDVHCSSCASAACDEQTVRAVAASAWRTAIPQTRSDRLPRNGPGREIHGNERPSTLSRPGRAAAQDAAYPVQGAQPDVARRAHPQVLRATHAQEPAGNANRRAEVFPVQTPVRMGLKPILEPCRNSRIPTIGLSFVLNGPANKQVTRTSTNCCSMPCAASASTMVSGRRSAARMAAAWSCSRHLPAAGGGRRVAHQEGSRAWFESGREKIRLDHASLTRWRPSCKALEFAHAHDARGRTA